MCHVLKRPRTTPLTHMHPTHPVVLLVMLFLVLLFQASDHTLPSINPGFIQSSATL